MTFIAPNSVNTKRLSLGGGTVYLSPNPVTSKASLPTDFRNLGTIDKDNTSEFNFQMDKLQWKAGTPSKTVYEAIINQEISFASQLSEIDVNSLMLALNTRPTPTYGTGSTTILATPAPTASTFTLSEATNFAIDKLIEIDFDPAGSGDKHYRRLKLLSGADVTLDEALKEAPVENDTVKEVSRMEYMLGNSTTPLYYGFKFEKKLPILKQKLTIILFKVAMSGQIALSFQDDVKNVIPVNFSSVSDPAVESGALGVAYLEPLAS